jgi:hypothetical protein
MFSYDFFAISACWHLSLAHFDLHSRNFLSLWRATLQSCSVTPSKCIKHEDIRVLLISSAMIYLHSWACFHFEACVLVVRVRSASLAKLRMRICYQNNGEYFGFFSQLCTCFAWGATYSDKVSFLSIYSCENYVVTRGVQRNPFSTAYKGVKAVHVLRNKLKQQNS